MFIEAATNQFESREAVKYAGARTREVKGVWALHSTE